MIAHGQGAAVGLMSWRHYISARVTWAYQHVVSVREDLDPPPPPYTLPPALRIEPGTQDKLHKYLLNEWHTDTFSPEFSNCAGLPVLSGYRTQNTRLGDMNVCKGNCTDQPLGSIGGA